MAKEDDSKKSVAKSLKRPSRRSLPKEKNTAPVKTGRSDSASRKTSSPTDLNQQLISKREELRVAQMGLGSTLQNPHRIKALKKEIARILTKINATKGDK